MNKRLDLDKSYGLEEQLAKSIERFTNDANKTRNLKNRIRSIRRVRKQIEEVPEEVIQWFKDTEGDDEENE